MAGPVENLIPPKPGEVRNPLGRNQYSYRDDFETYVAAICKEIVETDEPRAKRLARKAFALAEAGDSRALTEVLARLWPKTEKHEHRFPDGASITVEAEPPRLDEVSEILEDAQAVH